MKASHYRFHRSSPEGIELSSGGISSILLLLVLLVVAGCERSQDQVRFEQEAFRTPSNFTETTPNGEIVRRDENDWRIGPMFQGFIEVETPPYPNPTRGEPLRMELFVTHVGNISGLRAVAYYDMYDSRTRRTLYLHDRDPLEFGTLVFDFNPAEFDRSNSYGNARQINNGLHRLFIYDNRFNLITYGDIKLE